MTNRAHDWFAQAGHDLDMAEAARERGSHDWACFAAHQAAEKAVKSVHVRHGQDAWGHGVERLLSELPIPVEPGLLERAKVLDNFYVPTRYPDSHPEGSPFQHYGQLQSKEAIDHARAVIEFARASLAES